MVIFLFYIGVTVPEAESVNRTFVSSAILSVWQIIKKGFSRKCSWNGLSLLVFVSLTHACQCSVFAYCTTQVFFQDPVNVFCRIKDFFKPYICSPSSNYSVWLWKTFLFTADFSLLTKSLTVFLPTITALLRIFFFFTLRSETQNMFLPILLCSTNINRWTFSTRSIQVY